LKNAGLPVPETYKVFRRPEQVRNFDFKNNFLKEEITINNIVHEAGYLIRHPKTNMDTSVDQFYPLMSGLYMWWDDFDKKEKDRIERAYNLVKDSGWKLKRDTWYKKIMKGTIFPPFRLMALICTREMAVNKKLKWKHKAIRWCTDFLNFFYLSIVLWFTPTHKIQQLLVLEQNSLAYETLFNKINKVLYYNMFDVRKTFDVYFRYKESALWHQNFAENPPINLLVKYWLRRRG